jgi:thiol:disulfide interchange protein DsbA
MMLKKILLALTFFGVALSASAEPKNGVDYLTLPTPQATEPGGKIEVIEFFDYACPHCNALEPVMDAWIKAQGGAIVSKRIHVQRGPSVTPTQRLFFTLEAMGLLDQYHEKVFQAMHVERRRLNSDAEIFDFVERQGIDKKKFNTAYRSFGVDARIRRSTAMMAGYQINSWPMVAIDGRFITSPAQANEGAKAARSEADLHAQLLAVMDYLVARAQADKKK